MAKRKPIRTLFLLTIAVCIQSALAAPVDNDLLKLLGQLKERLEKLEQRNSELEGKLNAALGRGTGADAEKRLQALEQAQEKIHRGLDAETISQYEPELTARLKAVEKDALDMRKAAKKVDALDGVSVGLGLTTVLQRPTGLPAGTADSGSQLNYRGDITVQVPLEAMGAIEHKLFAHFRLGQGLGLNKPYANLGAFASAPDAVAFRASGANPDDAVAILGEAWYQAKIPLPIGGFKPQSRQSLELSFGKMDFFGFFDQNAGAGDEARQFLNSVFVHNPLLDAGGQIGVDANGFQPGLVAAYVNTTHKSETWRLSLGVFASGPGANYQRVASPLVIAQAESALRLNSLPGNYRIYAWRNAQGVELDGRQAAHTGWGLSLDQRLSESLLAFGRWGQMVNGKVPFDRALTAGAEVNGSAWGRGADALGLALGHLRASGDYRAAGGSGDLIGDGSGVFNFAPSGAERLFEVYYRYRISKQFELSPDFQYLWQMGGNPAAKPVKVAGLRAQLSY